MVAGDKEFGSVQQMTEHLHGSNGQTEISEHVNRVFRPHDGIPVGDDGQIHLLDGGKRSGAIRDDVTVIKVLI